MNIATIPTPPVSAVPPETMAELLERLGDIPLSRIRLAPRRAPPRSRT